MKQYIGIPWVKKGYDYDGCDCWGLAVLFYKNEFGIELPTFDNVYYNGSHEELHEGFSKARPEELFHRVEEGQLGDVIVFYLRGYPIHVGLWINDSQFLHCRQGSKSCLSRFSQYNWKEKIEGIYRHNALPESPQ